MTIFASFWNIFHISKSFIVIEKTNNNSFHRIYEADSDISDESDVESDLNISIRSNASFKSNQSFPDFNPTMNTSFSSKVPSVRSMSIRSTKTPLRATMSVLNASKMRPHSRMSNADLTRDVFEMAQPIYASAQSLNRPSSYFGSVNQLNTKSTSIFDNRCFSRLSVNDIPDDFESGITQLSINGLSAKRDFYHNQNGNTPSVSSMQQRRLLLQPSRLDMDEDKLECGSISAHQTSWIAGGYWNGSTSPTKRQSSGHIPCTQQQFRRHANEIFPMMSRTSSQSSGFESMKNGPDNNAVAIDHAHVHETVQNDNALPIFSGNASQMLNSYNKSIDNMPKNPFSSGFQNTNDNYLNTTNGNASTEFFPKQNTFDTSSLQMQLPNNNFTRDSFTFGNNFSKFNNTKSFFPRGNLFKIQKNGPNSNQNIISNGNYFMNINS